MSVVIIDYGAGNLRSVAKAFARVSEGSANDIRIVTLAQDLRGASHIVLPGVGAFADCMRGLKAVPRMLESLQEEVLERKKNFLGICVGMQMLFERGHEHGMHEGLGWLKGEVIGLEAGEKSQLKIPHMGWNELTLVAQGENITSHPLLNNIRSGAHAYFVHSYHAKCADSSDVLAITEYGRSIAAVVARGNIMGTQFHPEKSQETGLQLLRNFLELPV